MMIVPIFHTRERTPDPKCPHCKETLEGYSAPGNLTFGEFFIGLFLILFIIGQIFSMIFGFMDGAASFVDRPCEKAFSKRYHYVVPLQVPMCHFGRWITNRDEPEEKNNTDKFNIYYQREEVKYE